jgi:hypothetical protein
MSEHTGQRPPGPGEAGDERLVALGRENARTARRVADLESLVRQLASDVTSLAQFVGGASPGSGDAGEPGESGGEQAGARVPPVRAWLLTDNPERAAAGLAGLIEWLDTVYLAYSDAQLPSCWLWHPEVVEELRWLRGAHAEAYHPQQGSWLRVGDWHDRQRPGVVRRIRDAVGSCELMLHTPGHSRGLRGPRPPASAPLTGAAGAIAARHWTRITTASRSRGGNVASAARTASASATSADTSTRGLGDSAEASVESATQAEPVADNGAQLAVDLVAHRGQQVGLQVPDLRPIFPVPTQDLLEGSLDHVLGAGLVVDLACGVAHQHRETVPIGLDEAGLEGLGERPGDPADARPASGHQAQHDALTMIRQPPQHRPELARVVDQIILGKIRHVCPLRPSRIRPICQGPSPHCIQCDHWPCVLVWGMARRSWRRSRWPRGLVTVSVSLSTIEGLRVGVMRNRLAVGP